MKKILAKTILFICGWKIVITNQSILTKKKYILIAAPHTSAWDFVVGKLVYLALGLPCYFFIKDAYFKGFKERFMRYLGGIPIKQEVAKEAIKIKERMAKEEEIRIILTPEGTRKETNKWFTGFHWIAKKANVPVFIGVLDFGEKTCSLGEEFNTSNDVEEDMKQLLTIYNKSQAKYPDKFLKHGEERK